MCPSLCWHLFFFFNLRSYWFLVWWVIFDWNLGTLGIMLQDDLNYCAGIGLLWYHSGGWNMVFIVLLLLVWVEVLVLLTSVNNQWWGRRGLSALVSAGQRWEFRFPTRPLLIPSNLGGGGHFVSAICLLHWCGKVVMLPLSSREVRSVLVSDTTPWGIRRSSLLPQHDEGTPD